MADRGLVKIVGSAGVIDMAEVLEEYSGDSSFVKPVKPDCVVRPENVEQVQAVVRWANETGTPLVPVSSGPTHSRGDTVPSVDGTVIVDLSGMKRIVRIDTRNKVAMVEPGVTFPELNAALAKEGLCAYTPLAPRNTKSVVGSMLEREPVTMPSYHWDSTDPLLCAEVVFGTGDKFRTGEAMGPDTVEEQWEMDRVQMNPFGHSHVDFQRLIMGAQGTIGIVTWATLKCGYLSELGKAYLVPSETLGPLIELSYQLTRYRLGGKLFILNGLNLACLLGKESASIEALMKTLPPWVLFASFEGYGVLPQEKIDYESADFLAMADSLQLKPESEIPGAKAEDVLRIVTGSPAGPYWKTTYKGGFQDIFFLTTLDKTPDFTAVIRETGRQQSFAPENIGVYIQPVVQGTACHCEFNQYYDPSDINVMDAVEKLIENSSEKIAEKGGFFSRPYPAWKNVAYRGAGGTADMQRQIKQIFDPNHVLNPGKLCF